MHLTNGKSGMSLLAQTCGPVSVKTTISNELFKSRRMSPCSKLIWAGCSMKIFFLNLYTCPYRVKVCSCSRIDVSLNFKFNIIKYNIIRIFKKVFFSLPFPFIPLRFLIYIHFCSFLHLFNLRLILIPKRHS